MAVIKEERNGTVSNTIADEKSISMARKVMKIEEREKKSISLLLSYEEITSPPTQPYVGWMAELIVSTRSDPIKHSDLRSELDNHTNMVVAGLECVVFHDTKKTYTVDLFLESSRKLKNIRIVDVVVACDCPCISKTFFLLVHNVLCVHEVLLNLIPSFMMREGGIENDDCPKLLLMKPQVNNHSMFCEASILLIYF